jgi:hypothetical protein
MIRPAEISDIPCLVEMGGRFVRTGPYAGRIADRPDVLETLMRQLIEMDDGHVLVLERAGLIAGMIGMVVYPHPISGDRIAGEVFWWCEAKGRGLELLRAAEQWAWTRAAAAVHMVAPNDERVNRIYRGLRYTPLETIWTKECPTWR